MLLSCEDLITAVPNRFISPQFFKLLMQISLHYYNSITLPIRLKQCTLFWKEQYDKESIAHHQSSSHLVFRWPSKQEEANSKEAKNNIKTKLAWLFPPQCYFKSVFCHNLRPLFISSAGNPASWVINKHNLLMLQSGPVYPKWQVFGLQWPVPFKPLSHSPCLQRQAENNEIISVKKCKNQSASPHF